MSSYLDQYQGRKKRAARIDYSVVIPHGKPDHQLGRCVQSLLDQAHKPQRIIVVCNNGITASDAKAALGDLQECVRIVEAAGVTNGNVARNIGAEAAKTAWIAFLDCDDAWRPEYADAVRALVLDDSDIEFVYGSYRYFFADGTERVCQATSVASFDNVYDYILSGMSVQSSTMFVTKELFKREKWNNELRRHQDFDYFSRLFLSAKACSFVGEPLVEVERMTRRRHKLHSDCISVTGNWYQYVRPKKYFRYVLSLLKSAIISRDWSGIVTIVSYTPRPCARYIFAGRVG